jgi:ribosomal protein S18 acetylase RimI-like enzyme
MIRVQRRRVKTSDEPFMRRLHKAAYHDVVVRQFGAWDDEVQYALLTQKWIPEKFEIIEMGGEPIGCISVEESPEKVFVAELVILPEFQSRGIGGELMRSEIAGARQMGKPICLQVLSKNEKARAFYERLGFVVDGTTDRHFTMSVS